MKATAKDHASLTLDERGLCDLELLAVGGFSPLKGFLGKADYERVVAEMRLADGTLWPLPVTLPVTPGDGVAEGKTLALRDVYGNLLAFLHVEEIYAYDKETEARNAYGTTDAKHPVGRLPEPPARPLRRRPARSDPDPAALRLRRAAADPRRAPRALPVAGLDAGRRLPDPQPPAPGPRGADQARRRADRRRPADPPGRRRDQAGRRRPLHPRPLLPGPGRQLLRARLGRPEPPAAGDADGRPARGPPARDHPPQPRLHRTSSSAATTPAPATTAPASPSTRPYAAQEAMAKHKDEIGMGMVDFKQMVYLPDEDRYSPVDEVPAGRQDGRHLGHPGPRQLPGQGPASSPSGSAARPWPRSSTRPARRSSARA